MVLAARHRRFAENLEEARRAADADTISLIGISFGGFPAVEDALEHPGRVRRLVLSSAQVSASAWQRTNICSPGTEGARWLY